MSGTTIEAGASAFAYAQDEATWMPAKPKKDPLPADETVCAGYLKALGDPIRLQIVRALQSGPLSVSDLGLLLELEIANVSHHLRVLFHADLVTTQREGKYVYYHLNQEFLKNQATVNALDFGCCKIDLRHEPR